jgi:hypothetical protein
MGELRTGEIFSHDSRIWIATYKEAGRQVSKNKMQIISISFN